VQRPSTFIEQLAGVGQACTDLNHLTPNARLRGSQDRWGRDQVSLGTASVSGAVATVSSTRRLHETRSHPTAPETLPQFVEDCERGEVVGPARDSKV